MLLLFFRQASQWHPVTRVCQTSVEVFTIRPRWASDPSTTLKLFLFIDKLLGTKCNCLWFLCLQSFDKQGFHAGTPPPFNLPSALGGPGPLNPGAAPGGYAPAPFLHILPHQQPHSQLLHHHLAQDGQVTLTHVFHHVEWQFLTRLKPLSLLYFNQQWCKRAVRRPDRQ